MARFKGFIGDSYKLTDEQWESQVTLNMIVDVDESQKGKDGEISALNKMPGLKKAVTPASMPSGNVRGMYVSSNGNLFAVVGSTLITLTGNRIPFTAVQLGTLQTSGGIVRFADNGRLVCLVDGSNGYTWDLDGILGFEQIIQEGWLGATHVDILNSRFIFNQPGTNKFYWSDPDSINLDPLSFDFKNNAPDPIAGLVVVSSTLWLIGTQTTEVWVNNPDVDIVFSRQEGAASEVGCPAGFTITKTELGAFWVAQNNRGGAFVVYTGQGMSTQKCSNLSVELALQKYQTLSGSTAYSYQKNGHFFYVINPKNGVSSWAYDYTAGELLGRPQWCQRTRTNSRGIQSRYVADNAVFFKGYNLVGAYDSNNIYQLDDNTFNNDGEVISCERIAPHLSNDMKRVFYDLFQLDCRVGVGTQCDPLPVPCTGTPAEFTSVVRTGDSNNTTVTLTWDAANYSEGDVESNLVYRGVTLTQNALPPVVPTDYTLVATLAGNVVTYPDNIGASSFQYDYWYYVLSTSATEGCDDVLSEVGHTGQQNFITTETLVDKIGYLIPDTGAIYGVGVYGAYPIDEIYNIWIGGDNFTQELYLTLHADANDILPADTAFSVLTMQFGSYFRTDATITSTATTKTWKWTQDFTSQLMNTASRYSYGFVA